MTDERDIDSGPDPERELDDDDDLRRRDPDRFDVPVELLEHEGERVTLRGPDGEELDGTLVVVAGTWGHARRSSGEDWPPPGPSDDY